MFPWSRHRHTFNYSDLEEAAERDWGSFFCFFFFWQFFSLLVSFPQRNYQSPYRNLLPCSRLSAEMTHFRQASATQRVHLSVSWMLKLDLCFMILWHLPKTNEDAAVNRKQEESMSASLEALPSNNITIYWIFPYQCSRSRDSSQNFSKCCILNFLSAFFLYH